MITLNCIVFTFLELILLILVLWKFGCIPFANIDLTCCHHQHLLGSSPITSRTVCRIFAVVITLAVKFYEDQCSLFPDWIAGRFKFTFSARSLLRGLRGEDEQQGQMDGIWHRALQRKALLSLNHIPGILKNKRATFTFIV